MDDRSRFRCLNPDCPDHGERAHGNLTVPARSGPSRARRLRRSAGATRFSERTCTPPFDARLPADKATAVLGHPAEGVGTRRTARLTGAHRDAVTRYARPAGDHAQRRHDGLAACSPDGR